MKKAVIALSVALVASLTGNVILFVQHQKDQRGREKILTILDTVEVFAKKGLFGGDQKDGSEKTETENSAEN